MADNNYDDDWNSFNFYHSKEKPEVEKKNDGLLREEDSKIARDKEK